MKKNLGEVVFYKNVLHNFMLRLKKKNGTRKFYKIYENKNTEQKQKNWYWVYFENNVTSIRDIFQLKKKF